RIGVWNPGNRRAPREPSRLVRIDLARDQAPGPVKRRLGSLRPSSRPGIFPGDRDAVGHPLHLAVHDGLDSFRVRSVVRVLGQLDHELVVYEVHDAEAGSDQSVEAQLAAIGRQTLEWRIPGLGEADASTNTPGERGHTSAEQPA